MNQKSIIWHIVAMIILSLIILMLTVLFLRIYTKHGSKVEMQDYTGMNVEEIRKATRKQGFDIQIIDSVYIVDREGNTVIRQSPSPGSLVKPGRKVYLTVTKAVAEEVTSGMFPDMYGKNFENVKILLERRFNLRSNVKERKFDPGPKDVVLEAYYGDQLIVNDEKQNRSIKIPKGETIDFVLSQRTRGPIAVPKLVCLKYSAIDFVLKSNELRLGNVTVDNTVSDTANAYVVRQSPVFGEDAEINIGEKIDVYLSANPDPNCF